jgi:hypothetical protein
MNIGAQSEMTGNAERRRRQATLCLLVLLCMGVGAALADDDSRGSVEIRTAYTELRDGVFYVNGRVEFSLSEAAFEALAKGVRLDVELHIDVNRFRRFIWDDNVAGLRQRYRLNYHALTERYVVVNANTGDADSFASIDAALDYLGNVQALPLIDEALLDKDARYEVAMRAVVDVKELKGPLKVLSRFWGDWRIASGWYTWPLRQ